MSGPYQTGTLKNGYEPRTTMRTFTGVAASLLSMGLPIGLTEFFRPGGDTLTWQLSFVATILAIVLAIFSIRGTLKE